VQLPKLHTRVRFPSPAPIQEIPIQWPLLEQLKSSGTPLNGGPYNSGTILSQGNQVCARSLGYGSALSRLKQGVDSPRERQPQNFSLISFRFLRVLANWWIRFANL
jgi:hypothetical protein